MKKLSVSAMLFAVGLTLPFLTGQIKEIGNLLLPMHIPVLLCGPICGWKYGLAVGVLLHITRSLIFTMPQMYPTAVAMSFELMTYGLVVGLVFSKSKWNCIRALYRALILAMIAGRAVWGLVMSVLLGFGEFTASAFLAGAFTGAIPGIVLQLTLIPAIMVALGRAKLVPIRGRHHGKHSEKDS